MILTDENYYSQAANMEYMSVSQFKSFCGTYGHMACEARAMAELRAQLPQLVAEAMHTPKVEIEVDEKSYKTAKQKIEDLFNMIFRR